jgi:hypothetical protein
MPDAHRSEAVDKATHPVTQRDAPKGTGEVTTTDICGKRFGYLGANGVQQLANLRTLK